jgi:hypothetical protein
MLQPANDEVLSRTLVKSVKKSSLTADAAVLVDIIRRKRMTVSRCETFQKEVICVTAKCTKIHVQQSKISKISRGLNPRIPLTM